MVPGIFIWLAIAQGLRDGSAMETRVKALLWSAGSVLSVESNQNVESKTGKCGVQNSIFTSRSPLV